MHAAVRAEEELPDLFKSAMRRLTSSVSILTTLKGGGFAGMTVTSATSLSADPPSMLVCVNRTASMHGSLGLGQPICVNLLGAGQTEIATRFAGKVAPTERFEEGVWDVADNGVPILRGSQASVIGQIDATFEYGSHTVFVIKVEAIRIGDTFAPLIFGEGRFLGVFGDAPAVAE
jgi:flavin reductase